MIKNIVWIYISSALVIVLAKGNYPALTDTEIKYMQHKWDQCCETNKCIHSSCYIVEWAVSGWATIRQRCQSRYPDWPYNIDIFQIRNENDITEFWNMLQEPVVPVKEIPKTIWTSGARCSRTNSTRTILQTQWISTKEPFPAWLDERINGSLPDDTKDANGCEFLVILLAPNNTDVKYDFQDQNSRHSAICEFTFPEVKFTTKFVTEAEEQKSPTVSLTEMTTVSSTSMTESITKTSLRPSIKTTVPEPMKSETHSSEKYTTDVSLFPNTTSAPKYCKGINQSGINWPDTLAGRTVRQKCPEGMIGFAEWHCDETSLRFQPSRPKIENCKHEWIDRLEDSIRERHDAVEISTKLAEDTKQNMSHGDIIALVNLTSNLLQLYTEQKGEEEFEVTLDEEVPIYYNFTKTMIESISNILRTEIKDAWEGLNETRQTREASTILKLVTTIGSRLSCIKTSDEKLQFTVSEENIDLQTFILNNTDETDEMIVFPEENEKVKSNSSIRLPANLKLKTRFSPCKTYNTGVGVIYKHVGDFLKSGQLNGTSQIATEVVSFSLSNATEAISLSGGKVHIILQHSLKQDVRYKINLRCVFWNFSKSSFGAWDDSGCVFISFNGTHSECQCDHLTNFAVLMDIGDNIQDSDLLTMMTYVCCGLSSLTLVLTLICFLAIRALHGRRSIITGNLCFSLLITNMLIIFGLDETKNEILCAVVAGVLHYWILAAFCWMLVEGYHLYRMVILVFQRGSNLPVKFYYMFAYGAPLAVVGISAGIRKEGYGGKKYCWLSRNDGLMWSFVGPACAIILVNIVIFILTLRSASSVKIKREQTTIKRIKSWIRGSLSVMCLLGLTWCIGLLYIDQKLHFFSYIFTVLNGLQGVFIFLFHILLNDKVNGLRSCSANVNKKFGRRKYLNHTSSNQTNSKTSTRTSMNSIGCTSSTKLPDSRKQSVLSILRSCNTSHGEIAVVNRSNSNKKCKVLYPALGNEPKLQASPL